MIPELRQRFNELWSTDDYMRFLQQLRATAGTEVGFRCLESPVFLPRDLLAKMVRYGRELYDQLATNQDYRRASNEAIPAEFNVPNEPEHPLFIQADFGLVREADGTLEPKLVEIQGFPSIYGFQAELAQVYRESMQLEERLGLRLDSLLDGLTSDSFRSLMAKAIVGDHTPEQVVLLEIDPFQQKTLADFLATQRLLGIRIAPVTELEKRGRKLFFKGTEIRRIYNRVIADELVQKQVKLPFRFSDDLDVEWAGHPNWFFRLSKYSLPWFHHSCVPPTRFLSDIDHLPGNLDQFVLKPLYSFAGAGVKIGPAREEIEAIPPDQRRLYILQQRMDFVPTIRTPAGNTKVEVRVMYIRSGNSYRAVNTVVRTGRGKMMGVDFNKNLEWVGASAGFFPADK